MKYKYHPKTKKELIQAIKKEIFEVRGTSDNPNWNANLNCIDTYKITDMSFLFSKRYGLYKFNGNISQWDVSSVKDMEGMFKESKFNGDISRWDVSNVKNMSYMFEYSNFNGDISKWNVSNVKDMESMFAGSSFNGDISKWDVSNVKDMEGMFHNSIFDGNIGEWNVGNVKNMSYMFTNSQFNGNISKWDVGNVKNMSYMFIYSKFNGNISEWDVSSVETTSGMFKNSQFNGDISNWNVSNVKDMESMFAYSYFNKDISNWDVSNVEDMEGMFKNAEFNGDIGDWNTNDEKRKETELNNISADEDSDIVPDRIVSFNTLKRIIKKGLLKEALTNIDKNILGDELFIVDGELRRHNEELVKKLLTKYRNIVFNKKELNKILGKNSDLLNKPYTKRIMEIYKRCDEKEEREKILAATVVIPYTKENKLQLKKEFGRKDNDEIQISS